MLTNLQAWDELDEKLGFPKLSQGAPRQGWLVNMKEVRGSGIWKRESAGETDVGRRI